MLLGAYNRQHLDFLRHYLTGSLASRLPRWMKLASNRDEVMRCIERLTDTPSSSSPR